ncbi:unnamed protein product [Ectocarpus fasciculatus]
MGGLFERTRHKKSHDHNHPCVRACVRGHARFARTNIKTKQPPHARTWEFHFTRQSMICSTVHGTRYNHHPPMPHHDRCRDNTPLESPPPPPLRTNRHAASVSPPRGSSGVPTENNKTCTPCPAHTNRDTTPRAPGSLSVHTRLSAR